jgi:hypothetical protein
VWVARSALKLRSAISIDTYMSTQELTYYLPRLNRRSLKRKLALAKLKSKRFMKAKLRKARSKALTVARRQYYLNAAQADLRVAVSRNEDIVISTIILASIIIYSVAAMAANMLLLFMMTAYDAANTSGANMMLMTLITIGSTTVFGAWVLAFIMSNISLSIMDGATGKKLRSLRSTVRRSLRSTSRVASVWFLIAVLIGVVLAALGAAGLAYISLTNPSIPRLMSLAPAAIGLGIIGVLFVLAQYSLAPYVTLFEAEVSPWQALGRSRQLVRRRGQLFIVAVYATLIAGFAAAYKVAAAVDGLFGINTMIIFAMSALAEIMFANGILVMLYRKRKLARKN